MGESVAVRVKTGNSAQMPGLVRDQPIYPSLYHTLEIARRGCSDPSALSEREIVDLARTMLMHYAHMGIA